MRTIIAQTGDLARLATDTFLITQMEAGHFDHRWQEVELGPFILEAVTRMQTDHPLVLDVPAGIPRLASDPDRLRQLLTNLISNAVKYSPGGEAVTVRGRRAGSPARSSSRSSITAWATAGGPDRPPVQEVRAGAHRRPQHISGTGLGLYICRLIVDARRPHWAELRARQGEHLLGPASGGPGDPAPAGRRRRQRFGFVEGAELPHHHAPW